MKFIQVQYQFLVKNCVKLITFFVFTTFTCCSQMQMSNAEMYGKTYSAMSGYKPLREMMSSLFQGYEKRVRPFHKGSPLEVQINTYIVELLHVDEFYQEFTLDLFIREFWVEPRLTFIPQANIGSVLHIDPENMQKIWVPDTFISNERKHAYYDSSIMREWMRLKSDGEIRKSTRKTITAACPMTFYFYPFDRHVCTLDFESFRQDNGNINYEWRGGSVTKELFSAGISFNATNGTIVPFRVMSLHANKYEIEFSSGNFSRLSIEITLRKFWGVYFSKFYVPLFLFLLIALSTLRMRKKKAGFILNICNLIFFHLFLLIPDVGASVPRTYYFKANDVYLYFSMAYIYLSFLLSLGGLIGSRDGEGEKSSNFKEIKSSSKTYVHVGKELSPDDDLKKHRSSTVSNNGENLTTIETQTYFTSRALRLHKCYEMLKWIIWISYLCLFFIFWILVFILSKAYLLPEELVLVDYDF